MVRQVGGRVGVEAGWWRARAGHVGRVRGGRCGSCDERANGREAGGTPKLRAFAAEEPELGLPRPITTAPRAGAPCQTRAARRASTAQSGLLAGASGLFGSVAGAESMGAGRGRQRGGAAGVGGGGEWRRPAATARCVCVSGPSTASGQPESIGRMRIINSSQVAWVPFQLCERA